MILQSQIKLRFRCWPDTGFKKVKPIPRVQHNGGSLESKGKPHHSKPSVCESVLPSIVRHTGLPVLLDLRIAQQQSRHRLCRTRQLDF